MNEQSEAAAIHRGLKGVYFDRSRVCFIDGRAGELLYRGYSIHDLAERSTFEETCYLLLHGELPSRHALARFDAELKAARKLPAPVYDIIRTLKPSERDELEITDVNRAYIDRGQLSYSFVTGWWKDAGTHEALSQIGSLIAQTGANLAVPNARRPAAD